MLTKKKKVKKGKKSFEEEKKQAVSLRWRLLKKEELGSCTFSLAKSYSNLLPQKRTCLVSCGRKLLKKPVEEEQQKTYVISYWKGSLEALICLFLLFAFVTQNINNISSC